MQPKFTLMLVRPLLRRAMLSLIFIFSLYVVTNAQYCVPSSSNCSFDDAILNVSLNALNNTSTCASSGYTYYSSVAATDVYIGLSNRMSVSVGPGGTEHVSVWIDYDRSGTFDANEFTSLGSGDGQTITNNLVVPSNLTPGVTRMRVRVRFFTALTSGQACTAISYGETEDYNINLAPCVPAVFTSQPANASIVCGGNATFSVSASGSFPTYTWQYRTSTSGVWQNLVNGGVVSGATTNSLTLTNVPETYNGNQIRAVLTGACAAADPGSAATLTVAPIQTTVNPSSAAICSGATQLLAITNIASTSAPITRTFTSTDVPKAIPDNSATGALSNIVVSGLPAGATITGLAVKVNLPHTYIGDITFSLRTPSSKVINLNYAITATYPQGAGGLVNTVISSTGTTWLYESTSPTYTGTFRADLAPVSYTNASPASMPVTTSSWSSIWGDVAAGTYTLGLRDIGAVDVGTLTSWSLDVTYVLPAYGAGVWTATPAVPGTMFRDAAGLVPYNGELEDSIYVKPTQNTVYSVFFNSTLSPCVSAPARVAVNVGTTVAGLAAPATIATCVGSGFTIEATHTAVPSTNAAPTYQWQVSADGGVNWSNISGATGTTLNVASTTQSMNGYRYRISVTSGGCATVSSTPTVLTVNPLPTVTLSAPATTLTPGKAITITGTSSPAAATWTWKLNGATIAGTTNTQVVNVDGLGTYQATVVDVKGCVNTSNTLTFTADASDKLWIYPNPTTGAFQIRYYHAGDANEKRIISVYNAAGQLVASKSFDLTYTSAPYLRMDVDLSGASRGTYVVKVGHEYSGKIVSGLVLVQ